MRVNSFDCFVLVKDALGLLSFAVIDILNGDVPPCSFAVVPIFFFLSHCLIKPTVVCLLVVFGLLPYFFVDFGGISKCLILVFDQSWSQLNFYRRSPFVSEI